MYLPINVDIREKKCLVVGGGNVAERKIHSLLQAGACLRVVSPEVTKTIQSWANQKKLDLKKALFKEADVAADTFLVIGATDDPKLQKKIAWLCLEQNRLVNIVDQPKLCNFTLPAVVKRGKLNIAISTDGASPALSRRLRQQLEKQFGEEYAVLLDWLGNARKKKADKSVFEKVLDSDVLNLLKQGKKIAAEKLFKDLVLKS